MSAPVANTITVYFPAAGTYPYELDYAASNQNSLIFPGSLWQYSLNNPTGFYEPGFDASSFVEGLSPFTNAVGYQSPGFGCPLIGNSYFPVFGTVDLLKTIYLPSGTSNVTAYVAIDNDFTLWINGTEVTDRTSEGCAYEWNWTVPIPDNLWVQGNNIVAFQARDRGGATGFETELIEGAGTGNNQPVKGLALTMSANQNSGKRAITLTPANSFASNIGQAATFSAIVADASGTLVPNHAVIFNVAGANPQQSQLVTDNTGTAVFTYHGFNAGADVVQAQALVTGATVVSAQTSVTWNSFVNQPPVVNAGPNQTIAWPSNTVILTGTATDDGLPNGTLTVAWAQISGPAGAYVSTPNQLSTVVLFTQPGTYGFQLTASDSALSTSSTVTVAVTQPNQPPVINITADTTILTLPANTVNVTGAVTDDGLPAGAKVTEQWTEVSGPGAVSFTNPAGPNTQIVFPSSGSYVLQLTASDTQLTSSVNLAVTVNPPGQNQAPVVSITASPATITLPANVVTLNGKVTDDGLPVGSSISVQWSQLSGPQPATFSTPTTAVTQVGLPAAGVYIFQLAASDTQLTGTAQVTITVNAAGSGGSQPPTVAILANYTTLTLPLNTAILTGVVNGGASPSGPFTTQWSQVSGPAAASFALNSATSLTAAFPMSGLYGIQFTANVGQLSSTASINITVQNPGGNQSPTVNAGPNQTIQLPQNTLTLNGYASDDGLPSGTLTMQWSQISGPESNSANGYAFGQAVVVDHTKVPHTDQTDFPVLISGTYPFLATVANGGNVQSPSGYDIIFTSDATGLNKLDHEIDSYDPVTGTVNFWVRIPTLSHTFDTVIYVFCGNSNIVASQENKLGAWKNGYVSVYHLSNGTTLSAADSLNANNGTNEGATATTGMMDGAGNFNGATSYIALPAAAFGSYPTTGSTTSYTLSFEAWFKTASNGVILGQTDGTMPGGSPGGDVPAIYIDTAGYVRASMFWHGSGSSQILSSAAYNDNRWHSLVDTYNDGMETLYVDGVVLGTQEATEEMYASRYGYFLGAGETSSWPSTVGGWSYLNGALDEARISAEARSADWIATEYANESSPSTFYKVGGGLIGGLVSFSNPSAPVTQATFSTAGTYVLQLSANDTQYTSTSQVTVIVDPSPGSSNQPPSVSAGASQTIVLPTTTATLNGVVTDNGLPNAALTIGWTLLSGPGTATFANAGNAVTTATFTSTGVYVLQLSASDGQYTVTATTTVTVSTQQQGANQPPTVNAGPNQTISLPNTVATLNGQASDDGLPQGSVLAVSWSQISGPAAVTFANPNALSTQATFGALGTYVVTLTASDTQLQTSSQVTITVASSPGAPPTVNIAAPVDNSEVTAPTAVTGTVSNGNWVLQYAAASELNPQAQQWTTFASGSGAASGSLGQLDPTLLLNGEYTVQLVATDNYGQTASASVTVEVGRNMKLGAFSIAFQDLSVPLPGLPITVTRTYDSRDRTQGDFGDGWRLSIANVRVQKNGGLLGLTWDEEVSWSGMFDQYCLQPARNHTVTATFPDGRVYRFAPSTSQPCQSFAPLTATNMTFVQVPTSSNTSGATLAPADGGAVLTDGDIPGPVNLLDYNGNPYDPTQFLLTTADGYTYTIDQTLGVTQVKDLNGNTLTINASGVVSSSGKSVAFSRDGQGRITQIADPTGAYLTYSYSGAGDLASVTDRAQNTTTFGYNNNHYLLNIKDPRGTPAVRSTYDASGRLLTTTDANGKTINYTQNIAGQIEQVQDRLGNTTTYAYDADGNILSMTDPLGNTTSYTYDAFDNKLTETNALHKTTTYTYDGLGNRLTEADPLGNTTTYTYNSRNQVLIVTDPQHHTTTNIYDANGNLTSTTDANGKTTTTVYAANGLPNSVTDAANNVTQFQYDGSGNLTQQTDALNHVSTYTYDANGNKLSQTVTRTVNGSSQTLTTGYAYDGNNRVTKTTYPDGSTTQVQYNSIGKQSATIDQLNRTTSYAYDADGNLTTTTYPDTTTASTTYDANNNHLTSTDRAGNVTTYTYDADNRLTKTTYADQTFTQTAYDAAGRVASATDANGHATSYGYDDAGRRTSITDALTHVTTFTYDAAGNQLSVKDANQNITQYQYDVLNRQIAVIYPDQTTSSTAYDALGRVSSKADQAGKVTGYGYDALGRLTSVTQDAVAGGLNLVTAYGYDEVGNRISQTDAKNHATTYSYDQNGRRVGRKLPAGQSESYVYDAAGNLKSQIDFNGKTTAYAYDPSNRLLSKTPDASFNAPTVSFTYTPNGLRQTMSDVSGATAYGYDTRNRLTAKQTPFGTLSYAYDSAGDLLTLKSSNTNGISDTYTYDVLNRLSTVTDPAGATTYSYDAVGNLAGYSYPNGVVSSYSYDALNRLTQMGSAKGNPLSSYTYTLGAAGNRLTVAELSGRSVAYGYDSLYRLISEAVTADPNNHNATNGYLYDAVGNRQQWLVNGTTVNTYSYDADDRLGADAYDADGNTINSLGTVNAYDFENHLVQHGSVTLVYDGDGNRVSETVGGVTTNYLVDTVNPTGYAQVVDELVSGKVTRSYSYGMERLSESQTLNSSWTPSFYGYDGHGSVRQLTSSTGAVTDSYDYDAFGNLVNSTGTTPNNYLFANEAYDSALGLYYNRARYLNTTTGRFWNMDTDEGNNQTPLSLNKYLYTNANPVDGTDPSGFQDSMGELGAEMSMSMTFDSMSTVLPTGVLSIFSGTTGTICHLKNCYLKETSRWQAPVLFPPGTEKWEVEYHVYVQDRGVERAVRPARIVLYEERIKGDPTSDICDTFCTNDDTPSEQFYSDGRIVDSIAVGTKGSEDIRQQFFVERGQVMIYHIIQGFTFSGYSQILHVRAKGQPTYTMETY